MVTHWEEVQRSPAMIDVWNRIAMGEMPFAKECEHYLDEPRRLVGLIPRSVLPLLVRELSRARSS